MDELKQNGFIPGDKVLTFYENFLTIYIAGGTVPGPLFYSFEIFMKHPLAEKIEKPKFIMIVQYQVERFADYAKSRNWNFPEGYSTFEIGRSAENLPMPDYNTLLFVKNSCK